MFRSQQLPPMTTPHPAAARQQRTWKAKFEAEIKEALADGVISEKEKADLEVMRKRFGIEEEHMEAFIKLLQEQKSANE